MENRKTQIDSDMIAKKKKTIMLTQMPSESTYIYIVQNKIQT